MNWLVILSIHAFAALCVRMQRYKVHTCAPAKRFCSRPIDGTVDPWSHDIHGADEEVTTWGKIHITVLFYTWPSSWCFFASFTKAIYTTFLRVKKHPSISLRGIFLPLLLLHLQSYTHINLLNGMWLCLRETPHVRVAVRRIQATTTRGLFLWWHSKKAFLTQSNMSSTVVSYITSPFSPL